MKKHAAMSSPAPDQVRRELKRIHRKSNMAKVMRSTIGFILVAAAIAVLVASLWMPVLQTYGGSMSPTLEDKEIVVSIKTTDLKCGDVIAFYYNNKILIKRVIAGPTDWVEVTEDGSVYVNGQLMDEPYIHDKALGTCDITFPYQVPDSRYFVMGDHRSVSIDSRSSSIGCIAEEHIVGKLVYCVWPLPRMRKIR